MKKAIRLCSFIVVSLIMIIFLNMRFKPNNSSNEAYDQLYSNAEVLILGSSHAYTGFEPTVIWEESGIPVACVGQPGQMMCMTYYQLKQILKQHAPQVIVVEVGMTVRGQYDYHMSKLAEQYTRNILYYPITRNFSDRIEISQYFSKEERLSYILGYPIYHSAYENVKSTVLNTNAGFYRSEGVQGTHEEWTEFYSTSDFMKEEAIPISEMDEEYLLRIINLVKENDIDLIFVLAPFYIDQDSMKNMKYVEGIAEENGIPFIDFNSLAEEIEFNYYTDMFDFGHCNLDGSYKTSIYFSQYLKENYQLEDRRDEPEYDIWNHLENNIDI